MQLDDVTAAIRPRTPYEAIDLGMAMARDAGRRLWLPWFAATLPVFLLCALLGLVLGHMWIAALALWWLKPMLDRVPLFVLSRRLFGETPGTLAVLRALPGLWSAALPAGILWERLDLARSLDMPVAQLEGLKWRLGSRRQRLLQRNARGPGVVLSLACLGMEMAFFIGAWALALMFVPFDYLPESFRALWAAFMTQATPLNQFINLSVWYLAISVMEPLYVAGGFALYLNRRTELEAWDLEIALKRMTERLATAKGIAAVFAIAALCLACLLHPAPADAAGTPAASTTQVPRAATLVPFSHPDDVAQGDEARFQKSAARAYQDPDLSPHELVGHWRPKQTDKQSTEAKPLPGWWLTLSDWVHWLGDSAAASISYLPWIIGLILLALMVRYRRWLLAWFGPLEKKSVAVPFDPQLKVMQQEEALPADVAAAAHGLWERGEARRALALLYRGGVARMQEITGRELPHGATEAQCLGEAAHLPGASADTLRRVVRAWQYAAYAHRLPEKAAFSELLAAWRADLEARQ
ncbi:MAG TPA: DUF4129 domain-containing protein [Gammaproteobacteria bacterium]